jgi:hypothetical protein
MILIAQILECSLYDSHCTWSFLTAGLLQTKCLPCDMLPVYIGEELEVPEVVVENQRGCVKCYIQ